MAHATQTASPIYGLLAEFDTAQQLLDAAHRVHAAGYQRADAYSPFPIHGLAEALGFHENKVQKFVFLGGVAGLLGGYGLEYYTQVIAYPLNIGGRPFHAWVNFIPPAFETTILVAAFTAVISMLALNGLPQPYHPVFNAERFSLASQDKFFLAIEAADPRFDMEQTRTFLNSLDAREVVTLAE